MTRGKTAEDLGTLQMALVGYEIERRKIEERIREIQGQLKGRSFAASSGAATAKPAVKRVLSPAARKRIAAAQKRRWAEHHKRQAMAARAE